jgi:hypothetical protein
MSLGFWTTLYHSPQSEGGAGWGAKVLDPRGPGLRVAAAAYQKLVWQRALARRSSKMQGPILNAQLP